MHFSAFEKARISGFYFFTFPYLFDALFLSRMPALKAQTGATETEIGWVLLTLGLCGLCALLSGNQLLRRVGSRRLCPWSMLAMCVVLVLGTRATTVPGLAVCAGLFGFFLNVSDLCANTHAVLVEVRYKKPTMSMLHAFYGIGLLIGSSAGGLAAALNLSPSESLGFMTIPAVLLLYPAWKHVEKDPPLEKPVPGKKKRERVPRLVWFCGLTVLGSYSVTGAAGDWGSLFMYTCKGANEETAALAYGLCGTSLAFFRLLGDWLRTQLGDRPGHGRRHRGLPLHGTRHYRPGSGDRAHRLHPARHRALSAWPRLLQQGRAVSGREHGQSHLRGRAYGQWPAHALSASHRQSGRRGGAPEGYARASLHHLPSYSLDHVSHAA